MEISIVSAASCGRVCVGRQLAEGSETPGRRDILGKGASVQVQEGTGHSLWDYGQKTFSRTPSHDTGANTGASPTGKVQQNGSKLKKKIFQDI